MTPRAQDPLFRVVESFFHGHLQRVRGASRHTVLAYRDTLRLFFAFIGGRLGRPVARLRTDDINVDNVLGFLDHLETSGRKVSTRNLRLTAIRSFAHHLVRQDPTRAAQYQRILSIPLKKAPTPVVTYLEPEEVEVLLRQPDRRRPNGLRDYALLIFLYNTGARVAETLALRQSDVQLVRPFQVKLAGKGRKNRICPLWKETAVALQRISDPAPTATGDDLFRSARGTPLSRDGADYIVQKYVQRAAKECPPLHRKRVTPHVFRHSCAVALLQAGVDITIIRDYLGHESIATTGRYTKTNLKMKRRVLEAFWRRSGLARTKGSKWRPGKDVLAFLSGL